MSCNCGKTRDVIHLMGQLNLNASELLEWGPILWKYLHTLAEKIGMSGNNIVDTDQSIYIENIITTLHLIIPCAECQSHAASYMSTTPFPNIKGLKGEQLRSTVRIWLFDFHNSVRARKGQPVLLNTAEDCIGTYSRYIITKNDYMLFIQIVAYAVRQGLVRIENWRKWYSSSERLRIITSNVVI